jgi:hypothetical protein
MATRPLHPYEIQEARIVFADAIRYERVRIAENASWPNRLASISARLMRNPPPSGDIAIALAYRLSFPIEIQTNLPDDYIPHTAWLIHELTHVWQYERFGAVTLFRSIRAHFRHGPKAYDYGGEAGLRALVTSGGGLMDLNPEQQGDVARDYYRRLKRGQDRAAWLPFVMEFQNT